MGGTPEGGYPVAVSSLAPRGKASTADQIASELIAALAKRSFGTTST